MALPELAGLLQGRLEVELSPKRAAHSHGVADFAAQLCRRHGLDPERGRVAGLAHDLCKEMGREGQLELAEVFARSASGFSLEPSFLGAEILHGPAAAGLLIKDYGCHEGDILEAVARHTLGNPEMGLLAILVYVADKVEPGRAHVDEAFRLSCLEREPRELLRAVVGDTIAYLRRKGRAVAPESLDLYNALETAAGKP